MIFKNEHYGRYTVYPTETMELLKGNSDAIALHLYLVSKPDNWTIRASDIEATMGWGRDRRRNAMAFLESVGLAKIEFTPGVGRSWDIYAEPVEVVDKPRLSVVNTQKSEKKSSKPCELFDAFWSEYPLKKGKAVAMRKWAKMDQNCKEAALRDVCKRKGSDPQWTDDGGKYIPHCSTYLNQEQWLDDWAPNIGGAQDVGDFF